METTSKTQDLITKIANLSEEDISKELKPLNEIMAELDRPDCPPIYLGIMMIADSKYHAGHDRRSEFRNIHCYIILTEEARKIKDHYNFNPFRNGQE